MNKLDTGLDSGECLVCLSKQSNATIADCGHKICYECAVKLMEAQLLCPFCSGKVTSINKIEQNIKDIVLNVDNTK